MFFVVIFAGVCGIGIDNIDVELRLIHAPFCVHGVHGTTGMAWCQPTAGTSASRHLFIQHGLHEEEETVVFIVSITFQHSFSTMS